MNLNLIPTDQQPTAIVAILRQNGALAADTAVQSIADANGDEAAAEIVAKLPALIVADIVRNFDFTKPGIVGALLTPHQLLEAVVRVPLVDDGKRAIDSASTMETVICGVILRMESKERGKYFRKLASSPVGLLALASVFPTQELICYHRHRTFTEEGEVVSEATIQVGNWQELAWALRTTSPKTFYKVMEVVITAMHEKISLEREVQQVARRRFGKELAPADDPFA